MINKQYKGFMHHRPSWPVDPAAQISAGMIAFIGSSAGVTVATVAASGTEPIGIFWKDHNTGYYQSTLESKTFTAPVGGGGIITLSNVPLIAATKIKVTNAAGTVTYTEGHDYSVNIVNGILTNLGVGIAAGATVVVWYEYSMSAAHIVYNQGMNYMRVPDDTLGSGLIAVAEGWGHCYTDQFDVTQAYTVGEALRSNSESKWTSASTVHPVCGKVIDLPTVDQPYLGIQYNIPNT